jgi:hypothetical protein
MKEESDAPVSGAESARLETIRGGELGGTP